MTTSNLARFSGILWRERDALGLLVTRLAQDRVGCDALLRHVRVLELHRAATGRAVALELGMEEASTLHDLTAAAPGEWEAVLAGHHRALRSLASRAVTVPDDRLRPTIQRSLREFLA